MHHTHMFSPVLIGIVVAIGCGSGLPAPSEARQTGKPQDAAATDRNAHAESSETIQLAQAIAGSPPTGGSASVRGTIKFEGTAPTPAKIKMDADPACQQQHTSPVSSEDVAVNANGTLKNVFVYVKEGVQGTFPAPTTAVTLAQSGCWYQPHVFGIQVNQPLEIVNNDSTLHNINAKPTLNQPFNVAQPMKGMKTTKKFAKPEVMVRFKCNVHPWMGAYGGVMEHPFFSVSGVDGSFTISGLPAGTYTLEAWHEKYGTQTQSVSIADGETKSIDFTFKVQ